MMHGHEKSDLVIVAMKPANKAEATRSGAGGARAGTKGNADQQSTYWTLSQARVSKALERIRQAIAVTHPRQEPYAGKPHVRIWAGGAMKHTSLPLKAHIHHGAWWRGGVAAGGAGAADRAADDRVPQRRLAGRNANTFARERRSVGNCGLDSQSKQG